MVGRRKQSVGGTVKGHRPPTVRRLSMSAAADTEHHIGLPAANDFCIIAPILFLREKLDKQSKMSVYKGLPYIIQHVHLELPSVLSVSAKNVAK